MSSTSYPLHIIPTYIIKEMSDIFYPIILFVLNLSLSSSKFPSLFKSSIIISTLKNNSLDPSQLFSYRPIANLSFISEVIEKVVYKLIYIYTLILSFLLLNLAFVWLTVVKPLFKTLIRVNFLF